MLFVLSALAAPPPLPSPRGVHLRGYELRATHGPTGVATLGWTGPGENVRPVFAVEGRVSATPRYETQEFRICDPPGCTLPPRETTGGTGVLASVGVQWVSIRGAVR